jgi:hypothetical protein
MVCMDLYLKIKKIKTGKTVHNQSTQPRKAGHVA